MSKTGRQNSFVPDFIQGQIKADQAAEDASSINGKQSHDCRLFSDWFLIQQNTSQTASCGMLTLHHKKEVRLRLPFFPHRLLLPFGRDFDIFEGWIRGENRGSVCKCEA